MTSSERIMGATFVNSKAINRIAWTIAALIIAVNGWLTYVFAAENLSESPISIAVLCAGVALYLLFVSYLILGPERAEAIAGSLRFCRGNDMAKVGGGPSSQDTEVQPLLDVGEPLTVSRV